MSWLFEGRAEVYLLLGVVAVVAAGLWWVTGKRSFAVVAGAVLGLIVLYFVLDRLVVTDREQISSHIEAMGRAVADRSADGIMRHVSDRFRLPLKNLDKAGLRAVAERGFQQGVTRIVPYDLTPLEISRAEREAKFEFMVRVDSADGPHLLRCKSRFVLDPDDQWRLQTFDVFDPLRNTSQGNEIPLP